MKRAALVLVALVALAGCKKPGATDDSTIGDGIDLETMRPDEAAQVVLEFQRKYGASPPPQPSANLEVRSMAQVLEIVRADRLVDYEKARMFAAGKAGPEALSVRSYLETSLAGALLLAAAILDEQRRQDVTELRQASQSRPLESEEDRRKERDRAAMLKAKTADLRKVVRALRVLSEEPLEAGSEMAQQAIRQDPQMQFGYLANANYYRLRGSWREFDQMMRYARDTEKGESPPIRTYLRAMEALERYVDDAKCRELLEDTLARSPEFVRAQANLVLVDRDIDDKYRQLQKLREMSPNHLVVRTAGPIIEQEYVTAQQLRGAFE